MFKRFILYILLLSGVVMAKEQTIIFAAGCFWGVEKYFQNLNGVKDAISGYCGGNYDNPNYDKVLLYRYETPKGVINHTESVKVIYDDEIISTKELLKHFWQLHDPTQINRQGNDIGNNYRSAIFYTTDEQKELAFKTKEAYQKELNINGFGDIATQIEALDKVYPAEEYHQNYLLKHPNGYCPNHSTGVKFKDDNDLIPNSGKEIVVVESLNCLYCKKLEEDVLNHYKGSTPLRVAKESEIDNFKLKDKIKATPTILFVENGVEVDRVSGYTDEREFYKKLGAFKLGVESEAYSVAFNKSTDARFCKRYDKFKHTPEGYFIDILSGDRLFSTKNRFDSGSGWLSFFEAEPGSVEYKEDFSYGMHRVEVLAKRSGIHLGHVFEDAPGGKKRYCINATVLEFEAIE